MRASSRPPDATAPDGSEIRLLVTDATRASLVEVSLPPGRITRPVQHRSVEEIWVVTEGAGQLWLREPGAEGTVRVLVEGDCAVIPAGWAFQFGSGPAGLRFLCYTSPPWPGEAEALPVAAGGLGEPEVGRPEPGRL